MVVRVRTEVSEGSERRRVYVCARVRLDSGSPETLESQSAVRWVETSARARALGSGGWRAAASSWARVRGQPTGWARVQGRRWGPVTDPVSLGEVRGLVLYLCGFMCYTTVVYSSLS